MDVYWLEQREADVPGENQWLSAAETICLSRLRIAKRRNDWRLGRWTAKRALAACFELSDDLPDLARIEIRATPSGAPEVLLLNQTARVSISLSHRAGTAMCAVAPSGIHLGCDLEIIEPRSDAFIADYLTANEQALVARASAEDRPLLVALLWSGKESALKALHAGLRLSTNCMDVSPIEVSNSNAPLRADVDGWHPLRVRYEGSQVFPGWWRHKDRLVRTIVSAIPLHVPVQLPSFSPADSLVAEGREAIRVT